MTVHIALLRAVNLGSHKKVSMTDLKAMVSGLGYEDVRTVLQSGNVVFRGGGMSRSVEKQLESEAAKQLGLRTEFMVRSAKELDAVVKGNPFKAEAKSDPAHLVVLFCKEAPGRSLKVTGAKREVVKTRGREVYVVYPDGIGRSRLKVDVVGTGRNWNTVLKLQELAKG